MCIVYRCKQWFCWNCRDLSSGTATAAAAAAAAAADDDDDDDDDELSAARCGRQLTTEEHTVDCQVDNVDDRYDDETAATAAAATAADDDSDKDGVEKDDDARDDVFSVKFAVDNDGETSIAYRRDSQSDEKSSVIDSRLQLQSSIVSHSQSTRNACNAKCCSIHSRYLCLSVTIILVSGEIKFIRIFAGDHPQWGR